MAFDSEQIVEQIATLPEMAIASHSGEELTGLWPLTSAERMDNDVKYAENLQVRITLAMAQILTGEQVTMPDAEFVYEGADEIPGRPQSIVNALLSANDAYEQIEDYSQTQDPALLFDAAKTLSVDWDDHTQAQIREILGDFSEYVKQHTADNTDIAHRFAEILLIFSRMLREIRAQIKQQLGWDTPRAGGAPEDRVQVLEKNSLPIMLLVNEFAEIASVPRLCLTADQFHGLLTAYATPNGDTSIADSTIVLAQALLPLASAEWKKHREDILWDPEEAKRAAKEEDERKNKEALAAKFAHIKDDSSKPEVEL